MWFLNFCSPFIYEVGGSSQTIRYILYISLIVQFLVYIFFILMYKIRGRIISVISEPIVVKNQIEDGQNDEEGLHYRKQSISYPGWQGRDYRLDQKQFKEWYLHYFGLHSVAVGGCIMYSPYAATLVFALVHTLLLIAGSAMQSCLIEKTVKYIYYILMSLLVLMDILLLFSISMGVGASGYDSSTKNCYLLE